MQNITNKALFDLTDNNFRKLRLKLIANFRLLMNETHYYVLRDKTTLIIQTDYKAINYEPQQARKRETHT